MHIALLFWAVAYQESWRQKRPGYMNELYCLLAAFIHHHWGGFGSWQRLSVASQLILASDRQACYNFVSGHMQPNCERRNVDRQGILQISTFYGARIRTGCKCLCSLPGSDFMQSTDFV